MQRVIAAAVIACTAVIGVPVRVHAQDDGPKRKLVSKVTPAYPELARRINLSGAVKLLVTVAPNGSVKKVEVFGGSPVLAQSAESAVQKWKW